MARSLKRAIQLQLDQLVAEAERLVAREEFVAAWAKYGEAMDLLPNPKEQWEAATWLLVAMGDVRIVAKQDYGKALKAFEAAVQCPAGLGNAFIHLRLGQCYFELGDRTRASDELTRAFMAGGREVFEDQDPKYIEFLGTILKPARD
ncbi:MAG: hypothetical protein WD768_08310 [Phycisphaeraceae bacterium]